MGYKQYLQAHIYIRADEFDIQQFTAELGVEPSRTRGLLDWPAHIINGKNSPEGVGPCCKWEISAEKQECYDIEIPIRELMSKFEGKEEKLRTLCDKYNLDCEMVIVVTDSSNKMPRLYLSKDIVAFLSKIGASINFDWYLEQPETYDKSGKLIYVEGIYYTWDKKGRCNAYIADETGRGYKVVGDLPHVKTYLQASDREEPLYVVEEKHCYDVNIPMKKTIELMSGTTNGYQQGCDMQFEIYMNEVRATPADTSRDIIKQIADLGVGINYNVTMVGFQLKKTRKRFEV